MIRSVAHPQTRAQHRIHAARYRRAWYIMAGVVAIALLLAYFGYFGEVTWPVLLDAVLRTTYRLVIAYGIALVLGVSIALVVGWSPYAEFFFPIFDILQNLPSF